VHQQQSPADARVTRYSAVIPRWPSAAILDFVEPHIAPLDPPTAKTLTENQTWSGSDAPFARWRLKLYYDLETGVRGYSRSSKAALFNRAHKTLYSSSIVTPSIYYRFRDIAALVENCYPLVFGAPIGGEAVRFTQQSLETKN